MLLHFFLLRSMPWFVNDDGNLDGLFYFLMIATQICQQVFHIFIQDYTVFKIVHLFYFLIINLRTPGRPGTQIWNIQLFCFAILYGKEKYNKQKLNKRDKNTANQTKRITSTSLC